jgi:hypothetical protein
MRALALGLLTTLALAAPAAAWHPIAGRYGGHEINGSREIHFWVSHGQGRYAVHNFRETHRGHTNTLGHDLALTDHWFFRFFTSEGEIDFSGQWSGPGTVEGSMFVSGGHSYRWRVHHLNEVA